MERNREVGSRGSMARRRHRITSLRKSSDGDREVLNENKRRRVGRRLVEKRCSREDDEDEEGDGGGGDVDSTDESFCDAEEEEEDDRRMHRSRASPSSSSVSNHGHRQIVAPARGAVRSSSAMRITDEIVIGVPVPRKARSASTKRSHEDNSHLKYTPSPVTFGGKRDGTSPSSSSESLRNKKMKSLGMKTRLRLSGSSVKSSVTIQDDIEIEVAEALFDLMKQSHSPLESKSSMKQERCNDVNVIGGTGKNAAIVKEAGWVPNGLVSEIKSNNEGKMGTERCLMKSEHVLSKIITVERMESNKGESVRKEKDSIGAQVGLDMLVTEEGFVAPKEESQPCGKPSADNVVGLASSKVDLALDGTEEKQEERFKIDLMAPLLPSSPKRVRLTHTPSDHTLVVTQDAQMKSEVVKAEDKLMGKREEQKKVDISYSKGCLSKFDLKLPYQANGGSRSQQEGKKEPHQWEASIPGGQKLGQLSPFPFPIAGSSWPTGVPHSGCLPPLQIGMPIDGSVRSVVGLQQPPFSLPKPRPKRCTSHQFIARSIQVHQQLVEKSMQPAATMGGGVEPHNLKPLLFGQNVNIGNTSPGDLLGHHTLPKVSGLGGTDNSSVNSNSVDAAANGKQWMLQQGPAQASTANMLHGQALMFQLGPHNSSKAPTNQSGPLKSGSALGNASLPSESSSPGGAPVNASASPPGNAAVSFNKHANFPSNATPPPYMAIFPSNGYPFSLSANVGGPPLSKGGSQAAPILPFHNASYYSSPMFQIPQSQPKQPHSQPQAHTSSHDTSTPNGSSSSSHVQPHNKPRLGAQISLNPYFPSMPMLLQQQPEKQRAPSSHSAGTVKPAAENGPKSVLVADSHASNSQKPNNNPNFVVPIQPINLAYMTPGTLRGNTGAGVSSNHSEQQQQGPKGVLAPPQAFELSFSSTPSTAPAHNFSSVAQHPAVFQMLPDMGRQMYPLPPGAQLTQQKNFQISEGKILLGSTSNVEERKGILGRFPVPTGPSIVNGSKPGGTEPSISTLTGAAAAAAALFDSSGWAVSFVQLPVGGSQSFPSSSSALPMTVVPMNKNSKSQHQQLHFQKQNQQMQLTGTTKFKEPISNAFPCSFVTVDSPHTTTNNNNLSQAPPLVQPSCSSAQSSNLNLNHCFHTRQVSSLNASTLKTPQSQTLIAFGSPCSSAGAAMSQGQNEKEKEKVVVFNHSAAACSTPNATTRSVKTAPMSCNTSPTSHQAEASQITPRQKSSTICRRNVPSILSASPSQLSELC